MKSLDSLIQRSQIFRWFSQPKATSSPFESSRIFQKGSKIFRSLSVSSGFHQKWILEIGNWALGFLLFSAIFSPRFLIGTMGISQRIDIRIEDILLLMLLSILGMKNLFSRYEFYPIASVEKAFLGFFIAGELSILNGFFLRTIDQPLVSVFYLFKWIEYFLIFIIATRLAAVKKRSGFFLKAFFFLGIFIACYGYWEYFSPNVTSFQSHYYRLFERPPFHGDANHIGGFFVLWITFFTGILIKTKSWSERLIIFFSLFFVFLPFLGTYSRKSYFALAGAFIFLFLLKKSWRSFIFLACISLILISLLPSSVINRFIDLKEVFFSSDPFHSSWAGNWTMWKKALWNFDHFFLLGAGFGARHRIFYESQYIMILSETGLLGFGLFFLLCLTPFRIVHFYYRNTFLEKDKGIALGWLMGFVGIMIHNLSCVSLSVVKIAIPFWYLTAVVIARLKKTSAVPL